MELSSQLPASLCKFCEEVVFGKQAWAKLWQNSSAGNALSFPNTRLSWKRLQDSVFNHCPFCGYLRRESLATLSNAAITVEVRWEPSVGVNPCKLHSCAIRVQGKSDSYSREHRISIYTGTGNIYSVPLKTVREVNRTLIDSLASSFVRAPRKSSSQARNFDPVTTLRWIADCWYTHGEECKQGIFNLPTRVADISLQKTVIITLSTTDSSHARQPYVTLSYCWGSTKPYMTTSESCRQPRQHMDLTKIPQTYKDAVWVTYDLGVRYLWIDALCIIQDSAEDKVKELSKMGSYYESALCVLAVSSASSSEEGFLDSDKYLANRDESEIDFSDGIGVTGVPFYDPLGRMSEITLCPYINRITLSANPSIGELGHIKRGCFVLVLLCFRQQEALFSSVDGKSDMMTPSTSVIHSALCSCLENIFCRRYQIAPQIPYTGHG
jgi:hypothetical protein